MIGAGCCGAQAPALSIRIGAPVPRRRLPTSWRSSGRFSSHVLATARRPHCAATRSGALENDCTPPPLRKLGIAVAVVCFPNRPPAKTHVPANGRMVDRFVTLPSVVAGGARRPNPRIASRSLNGIVSLVPADCAPKDMQDVLQGCAERFGRRAVTTMKMLQYAWRSAGRTDGWSTGSSDGWRISWVARGGLASRSSTCHRFGREGNGPKGAELQRIESAVVGACKRCAELWICSVWARFPS